MDLIGQANWDAFKTLIGVQASDTFFQKEITWVRYLGGLDRFNEDNKDATYQNITLKSLVEYDNFKKWPSNMTTETGELDRKNTVIWFTIEYLRTNNYLNANGNFDFDESNDRFKVDGITYKATPSTQGGQAYDKSLLFQIVLQREETPTGSKPF